MIGFAHHHQRTGAAHAGLGIDAGLPQGLGGVLQVHDLDAGDGSDTGLCGGSLDLFLGLGGLGGCLAGGQDLVQTGLLYL